MKEFNFSKKDAINASSSTPLQSAKNEVVTVTGLAINERADRETGETRAVGFIKTDEYGVMSTISGTAISAIDLIIDYMTEESLDKVSVKVKANTSRAGREFITLEVQ